MYIDPPAAWIYLVTDGKRNIVYVAIMASCGYHSPKIHMMRHSMDTFPVYFGNRSFPLVFHKCCFAPFIACEHAYLSRKQFLTMVWSKVKNARDKIKCDKFPYQHSVIIHLYLSFKGRLRIKI